MAIKLMELSNTQLKPGDKVAWKDPFFGDCKGKILRFENGKAYVRMEAQGMMKNGVCTLVPLNELKKV